MSNVTPQPVLNDMSVLIGQLIQKAETNLQATYQIRDELHKMNDRITNVDRDSVKRDAEIEARITANEREINKRTAEVEGRVTIIEQKDSSKWQLWTFIGGLVSMLAAACMVLKTMGFIVI